MDHKIIFSVVIPTHNRPELLQRALNSVRKQTLDGIEVIVVNDGSHRSYNDVLKSNEDIISHYMDYPEARGVSHARNAGIRQAKGEWIIFLDDDDEFYPNYFLKLTEKIQSLNNDNNVFLWANVRIINFDELESIRDVDVIEFSKKINKRDKLIVSAATAAAGYGFTVHSSLFKRYGGFDETFKQGEDTELIIRLMKNNITPTIVPAIGVVKYNYNTGRLSSSNTAYSKNKIYERIIDLHKEFLEKNKLLYSSLLQYCAYIHYDNYEFELGNRALFSTLKLPLFSFLNALRFAFLLKIRRDKIKSTDRL